MTLNDLEWPFYIKFSPLRTALSEFIYILTVEPIYRVFLLYYLTTRDVRKRTVIRSIFVIRGRTADLS